MTAAPAKSPSAAAQINRDAVAILLIARAFLRLQTTCIDRANLTKLVAEQDKVKALLK